LKKIITYFDAIVERLKRFWRFIVIQTKRIKLPFFEGLSLYDVLNLFFVGLYEGAITTRAGSVAFSFFMALFPAIIFIFTLIPYVAGAEMQQDIFQLLERVMPPSSYQLAESTIVDIVSIKRGDLLWLTLITTLIFATNGTLSLISNFSISFHQIDFKNFWQQYLSAILLTLGLTLLLIISLGLVSIGETVMSWVVERGYIEQAAANIIVVGRTVVLLFTILLAISLLYNYGPIKGKQWRLFSPGSILATTLILLSSYAFSLYVTNFAQYNKLYGSIGTLLIILLWIYINAIGLIIGFELNASISRAKNNQIKAQQTELDL
jgi:membrane protein